MRSQSPARRLTRIALWIGGVALAIFVLDLLGIPVREWIEELFDKLGEIPTWALVAGVVLQSAQTALAALAWFGILRAAPIGPGISYRTAKVDGGHRSRGHGGRRRTGGRVGERVHWRRSRRSADVQDEIAAIGCIAVPVDDDDHLLAACQVHGHDRLNVPA